MLNGGLHLTTYKDIECLLIADVGYMYAEG